MLRKLAWLILGGLLLVGTTTAQEITLKAVYQDSAGAVMIYDEASGESRLLLSADAIPEGAVVQAALSPDSVFAGVLVEQVSSSIYPYPEDLEGQTIAQAGLTNKLYLFSVLSGELILERTTLMDDFTIQFFMPGTLYEPILETNLHITWSPDGRRVAWVEGTPLTEGTNGYGRLVIFNTEDRTVTEIEGHGGTPFDLQWSPDGQYAIYRAISNFGTGAGYSSAGVYSLLPDNTVRQMPMPETERFSSDINPYGWMRNGQFAFSVYSPLTGAAGLFVYDVMAESLTTLLPESVDLVDTGTGVHPESGALVATISDFTTQESQPGTYLYASVGSSPQLILDGTQFDRAVFIAPDLIYLTTPDQDHGIYYTASDQAAFLEGINSYVYTSPYGVVFVSGEAGSTMIEPSGLRVQLPDVSPTYMHWLNDSTFVTFSEYGPDIRVVTVNGNIDIITVPGSGVLAVQAASVG